MLQLLHYIDCLEKPLKSTLQDFSLRKQ